MSEVEDERSQRAAKDEDMLVKDARIGKLEAELQKSNRAMLQAQGLASPDDDSQLPSESLEEDLKTAMDDDSLSGSVDEVDKGMQTVLAPSEAAAMQTKPKFDRVTGQTVETEPAGGDLVVVLGQPVGTIPTDAVTANKADSSMQTDKYKAEDESTQTVPRDNKNESRQSDKSNDKSVQTKARSMRDVATQASLTDTAGRGLFLTALALAFLLWVWVSLFGSESYSGCGAAPVSFGTYGRPIRVFGMVPLGHSVGVSESFSRFVDVATLAFEKWIGFDRSLV